MAFDFIAEYRVLQPNAGRDVITARAAALEKLTEAADREFSVVVDMAYFAYGLPFPVGYEAQEWFEEIVREKDSVFTLAADKEEAARIATLVLKKRLAARFNATPVLVHAAAFAGQRQTVDKHELSKAAQKALQSLVRRRGSPTEVLSVTSGDVEPAEPIDDMLEKLEAGDGTVTALAVTQAMYMDYGNQVEATVTSANKAIEAVRSENQRLAEEVDLLWWHLGGQSFLLDRPIAELPDALKPIVIGMDVGEMINHAPGPFGSYGIIRKALGDAAGQTFKLSEVLKTISDEFSNLKPRAVPNYAVTPLHGMSEDILGNKIDVTNAHFKRMTGLGLESKLTGYELAIQAFHERILTKLDLS